MIIPTFGAVLLLAIALLFVPSPASAQPPAADVRTVAAERLAPGEAVRIDGIRDEPAWQRVAPATGFLQREPVNGAPASERTDVRLLYDDHRLLLAIDLHDSAPDAVLSNQMQRDEEFDTDDSFAWSIDTFLDGRTGYYFEINPAGAMADGLILSPGSGNGGDGSVNRSWDGIWIARARRTGTGWAAEVEIPFRTLNFDPALTQWGVNFRRTVRRKNEESIWTGHALNQGLTRMVNAGRVVGFRGLSQGLGLDLVPYGVANVSSAPGRGRPDPTGGRGAGLDAFYNITPALRLNFSLNTDFAETEVDERRVNLTRFPLFFPEKRAFFLEGSSYFDFGRGSGDAVMPFFSRRIGRDDRGEPQRIDAGAKLTGRAGAFDVGLLQVRTGGDDRVGEDFSVLRVRRRLFQQSYVGALYTRRSSRAPGDVDRHTVGLDVGLQTSTFRGDKNLDVNAFFLDTGGPDAPGGGAGFGASVAYPNDPWTASFSALELQAGYSPALGFVERRGFRRFNPELEWAPRVADHPWIRGLELSLDWDVQNDTRNRALTREMELTVLQVNAHDGGRYQFVVTPQYERLEEDFEISDGVVLPAGAEYRFTRYQIEAETSDSRPVSIAPQVTWGEFFSGRRRDYALQIGVRPRRGVSFAVEAERSVLDLAEGSFTADVVRLAANTQFSPWISLANNVQYDTVSGELGWQARFRWIRRPGNDLFVVYTHNWRELMTPGQRRRLSTLDNRLATKLVYTLRF
ncbi:MAG: carbohydrate binding family 9 domain-containing protein [Acidobacteria bacterium]|nr:carbohydrate binding family 9 domain-containing protein [Acidobacteriota bacterium]